MSDTPELDDANTFFATPRTMGTADAVPLRDVVDENDFADEPGDESGEEKSL